MDEKQKRLWKFAAMTVFELIVLIAVCTANSKAMGLGFSGEKVAQLQRSLKQFGVYGGSISGIYDFETRNAVRKLFPDGDGTADRETAEYLGLVRNGKGFSAASEIRARYVQTKMNGRPFCEICKFLADNSPSKLLRSDKQFAENIKKMSSEPDIANLILQFEKNNSIVFNSVY